ncbi:MAG: porin, partial [Polaribacter sp.]
IYQNMKLSHRDFRKQNPFFKEGLRNTQAVNLGTEWRFNKISVRGGYKFEQNSNKLAINSDNLKGYSLGAGYNFGNFKIDFAYSNNNKTSFYDIYPKFQDDIDTADLKIDNRIFTATFSLSL